MDVLSPYYDPNWEKRHDDATLAWECCQHALRAVQILGERASPEDVALSQFYDGAVKRVHDAYLAQFRTVQEYAAWVFHWLPGKTWLDEVPDLGSFSSIEDVRDAAKKATDHISMKRARAEHGMPVGQPEGLAAFDETANVSSRFHVFAPGEIWRNESLSTLNDLPCIVNYQQIGDEHHFSITHEKAGFTKMAAALAIDTAAWSIPGIREVFAYGTHGRWRNRRKMKQFIAFTRQCHFYEHFSYTVGYRETFSKVALPGRALGLLKYQLAGRVTAACRRPSAWPMMDGSARRRRSFVAVSRRVTWRREYHSRNLPGRLANQTAG